MIKRMGERMLRAAKLDGSLYDEIKTDRHAPLQAAMVVILSSAAAGIGVGVHSGLGGFFFVTMQAMVQWYAWAFFTYLVGTRLLQEPQTKMDCGAMIRIISFASAPGVVRLLGGIPYLGGFVSGLASVWMLGATVIAVRKTLNYTTTSRAAGACVIGWVAQYLFMGILENLRDSTPGA
ncbi:hypothetical protein [Candidatus Methylomirabilis limnetica]|nr:hypothetical protein [Candidatus Methylomirabilis limnetica]